MSPTLGEIAGAIGTVTTAALAVWAVIGKGRESAQAREERLRDEQQKREERIRGEQQQQMAELRARLAELESECEKVTDQRGRLQNKVDQMIEFLNDVLGDFYPLDALKRRATDLLRRMGL